MLNFISFTQMNETLGDGTESFIDELSTNKFTVVNPPGELDGILEFDDRAIFKKASVYFSCRIIPTKKGLDSIYFDINKVELETEIRPIDDMDKSMEKTLEFKDIRKDIQKITVGKSPYFIEDLIIDMKDSMDPNFFEYRVRIGID
jgi:hypothetical protein